MPPSATTSFYEGLTIAQVAERHPELAKIARETSPDGSTYSGAGIAFFAQLARKNLMAAWESIDAKVLMFRGENDFVCSQEDHEFVVKIVNDARPGTAEFVSVPNSDHGFNVTSSPRDSLEKWGKPGAKFNDNFVGILESWLRKALAS